MRKTLILTAVALLVAAVVSTPTTIGAWPRRAVAVLAVQWGWPEMGVALLKPLAKAGDPVAQNNLAVLYMRGVGTARDPAEAARLLNAAAASDLPRARMNLMMVRETSCTSSSRPDRSSKLEEFARKGDRRAASFAADCLTWPIPGSDSYSRLLEMARIGTGSADPDEELKFGWLLLKTLDRVDNNIVRARAASGDLATAAATYLFRAAEQGRASAYEGISQIAAKYAGLITDDALSKRLAAKSAVEWIDAAAEAGHPRSRCVVGLRLATELAARNRRASDDDRQKVATYFETCMKDQDPRLMITRNGREQTLGYYRLFDVWKMESVFLITAPKYDNHDHDPAAQQTAASRIARLAKEF